MNLHDAVNMRHGEVQSSMTYKEGEVYEKRPAPQIIHVVTETPPAVVSPSLDGCLSLEESQGLPAKRYTEQDLLTLMGRMKHAVDFMSTHFYDDEGTEQAEFFKDLCQDLWLASTAYFIKGALAA